MIGACGQPIHTYNMVETEKPLQLQLAHGPSWVTSLGGHSNVGQNPQTH